MSRPLAHSGIQTGVGGPFRAPKRFSRGLQKLLGDHERFSSFVQHVGLAGLLAHITVDICFL